MKHRDPSAAERKLYEAAVDVKRHSYSPSSSFRVGAAVRVNTGELFVGTNMENASHPLATCAEQSAIGAAVSAGHTKVAAVAVAGDAPSVPPCGGCRQVIAEFGDAQTTVTYPWEGKVVTAELEDLLPDSFRL
jgi:cytidine deaminase